MMKNAPVMSAVDYPATRPDGQSDCTGDARKDLEGRRKKAEGRRKKEEEGRSEGGRSG
jgi:hypothetical protein